MALSWVWLWALLWVCHASERRLPLDDRPDQLHADDLDRFYLDYGASLIRWTDREEPAEEDATNLGYNRTEVRAGPFLQSGLVF